MRDLVTLVGLEFKLNRFQLLTVIVASAGLTLAVAYLVWQFGGVGLPALCTSVYEYPAGLICPEVQVQSWVRVTQAAEAIPPLLAILPAVAGVLVGGPAVSHEIERQTSLLAWTVGSSRTSWMLRRTAVILPILLIAVTVPATAAVILYGTQKPLIDATATFDQYGSRGVLVVARTALAFSIGLLAGAWLGRLLPALVVGLAAYALAAMMLTQAFPHLMPSVELTKPSGPSGAAAALSRVYRLPDGRLASWEEAVAAAPDRPGTPAYDAWESELDVLSFGYPAESALEVSLREVGLIVVIAGVSIASALVVVNRRKPY